MSQIFISYRREDSAGYAGRLRESLERRLGKGAVFRDVDALEPGQDFVDIIGIRLRDASACLVLIGREWLDAEDASGRRRLAQQNDYVRLEIATALEQPKMRVIPVLVEGTRMPATEELPETIQGLSRRQAVSLRDESWDEDVKRFVTALDRRSWVERYRLALAASAAVVVVGALAVAQFVGPQVSPDAETTRNAPSTEPVVAPAAPSTSPSTTAGRPEDALLKREGPQDQEPLTGTPRNVIARGGPASSPTTPLAGRTTQPTRTGSGRTGGASTPPSINPTVQSPAPASSSANDLGVVSPPTPVRRNDDDVVTRPSATPTLTPPAAAAAPPAVVIPPKPPAITPAALVRQTIAVYERAAEALEFDGVKRIWPAAPDALRNSYRNLRSQSVDLDCAEPDISGDTATISCKEQIRSVGAGGITLPVATNTAMFSLRRNGDAWEISRITRQRR
jgi:TIR domain-containing protein